MGAQLIGKLYDFGGECPKCKGADPMRVHCPRGCRMADGEHLDSMCLRCGYSWPARTADAEPLPRKETQRKRKGGTPT